MARSKKKNLKNANGDGGIIYKGDNRRRPWVFRVGDGMKVTSSGNVSIKYVELYHSETKSDCAKFQELYKSVRSLVDQKILSDSIIEQIKSNRLNNTIQGLQYLLSGNRLFDCIDYPTFSELYSEFYEYKETHKSSKTGKLPSPETMRTYRHGFSKCESIHNIPINKITVKQLQDIADSIKTYGTGTIDKVKKTVNGVYEYAISKKEFEIKNKVSSVEWEFVVRSENPRAIEHKEITQNDMDVLWQHCNDERVRWMLIMCYTGLRPDEFIKIETRNVFLDERYMIGGEKTSAGTDRIIPICERIYPIIFESIGEMRLCHHGEYNKTSYNYLLSSIHDVCQEFNLDNYTPHDCRDTFASMMDRVGSNKVVLQQIMGHKGKDVTEKHYIKKNLNDLLEAVNKLP